MTFQLAQDVIHPNELKQLCEWHWRRTGVANAHAPTAWFVEFIPGFGYRISPEPPWTTRGTLEDYSANEELMPDDDFDDDPVHFVGTLED